MRKKGNAARTPKQVKGDFLRRGATITAWAAEHEVSPQQVSNVLAGRNKGIRGKSHKIAVLLGMKDGEIVS